MRLFHIHRFKVTDLHFEHEVTYFGHPAYVDYKTLKCKCGKQKHVITNAYTAKKRMMPLNNDLECLQLVNKVSLNSYFGFI